MSEVNKIDMKQVRVLLTHMDREGLLVPIKLEAFSHPDQLPEHLLHTIKFNMVCQDYKDNTGYFDKEVYHKKLAKSMEEMKEYLMTNHIKEKVDERA